VLKNSTRLVSQNAARHLPGPYKNKMNLHIIAALCVIVAFGLYTISTVLGTAFGILGLVFEAIALASIIKVHKNKEHKE